MEPVGTFQGLASGINFRDLVDQIIKAESRPVTLMRARTADIDRRVTAWGDFQSRVKTLFDRSAGLSDGTLFNTFDTSLAGYTTSSAPLKVSAGSSAAPGSFTVQVDRLATREKLAGEVVAERTSALGFAGEFLVGGKAVLVSATDTLDDVAVAINRVNTGSEPSGVGATVVAAAAGGYRLVLTASETGAAGVSLADGEGGVLASLGFLDGTTALKSATSDGAKSDALLSSSAAVGTLLGLSSPPASASVGIGALGVTIDLASDSLDDIATAINTAAAAASSAVSATVVSETGDDGVTRKRLDVSGTTSFSDSNGILQTLGILEGGRSAVAHKVGGATFGGSDETTLLTAMGATVGETLTLSGRRGDGTTFTKTLTVAVDTDYGDLVAALNGADAFQSGSRTATAAIEAGRLVVSDDTAGDSRLSLTIVAHNEAGGTLDFGAFDTLASGRSREVVAGQDAELTVDGVHFSRASNAVTDVIDGVTLTLQQASAEEVTLGVDRDVDAIVGGIESFIKAYNAVAEFVDSQFTGAGAEEGQLKRPLSGDGIVRQMRTQLRQALETTISSSVTDVARLSELGITLSREGTYDIDTAALRAAVEENPVSVQRFFSVYGAGSTGSLKYVSSTDATDSGSYEVVITTPAEAASLTGSGFGGSYVDDGTADVLTITDAGTGSAYAVSLTHGMTLTEIVDALNAEFQTATRRELQAGDVLKGDAVGTDATDATLLADLHDALGNDLGIADGDTLTLSGTRDDGTSFFREWAVTDVTTQTLGDLRAEISDAVGGDVEVSVENGVLTARALEAGRKAFTLSVSSDNAGGGAFAVGSLAVGEAGRGKVGITASAAGGELALVHEDYGSAAGFDVAWTAGGADGSASLGVAAGTHRGVDVAGTLGGQTATGSGRTLTGGEGTAAEGLLVSYTGSSTGSVGSLRFSRGVAALMELAADVLVDPSTGSLKGLVDALDTQKQGIEDRIEAFELRLDRRAELLIRRFTALEEAMAKAQQQMTWVQAQLGTLSQSTQR